MSDKPEVLIDYTNWRGERRVRQIRVVEFAFRKSEYHEGGEQYLCLAVDVDIGTVREFALSGVHSWRQLP